MKLLNWTRALTPGSNKLLLHSVIILTDPMLWRVIYPEVYVGVRNILVREFLS